VSLEYSGLRLLSPYATIFHRVLFESTLLLRVTISSVVENHLHKTQARSNASFGSGFLHR